MSDINFNATKQVFGAEILNYRCGDANKTINPFEKNNIQFRIGSHYLKDFSDKGIEKFIHDNYNKKTGFLGCWGIGWGGKDLKFEDVKAFIQSTANNADSVKGMTFDLTDPELGLFDDDKITADPLKSSFSIKTASTQVAGSVDFVDTQEASFDLLNAQETEKKAKKLIEAKQKEVNKAKDKFEDAISDQESMENKLGVDAQEQLVLKRTKIADIENQISELQGAYVNISDNKKDKVDEYALKGISVEIKKLQEEKSELIKELNKKRRGVSFNSLEKQNAKVDMVQKNYEDQLKELDLLQKSLQEVQNQKQKIAKGENISEHQEKVDQIVEPVKTNNQTVVEPTVKEDAAINNPAETETKKVDTAVTPNLISVPTKLTADPQNGDISKLLKKPLQVDGKTVDYDNFKKLDPNKMLKTLLQYDFQNDNDFLDLKYIITNLNIDQLKALQKAAEEELARLKAANPQAGTGQAPDPQADAIIQARIQKLLSLINDTYKWLDYVEEQRKLQEARK